MAPKTYNIDDPENINHFLALLGGTQISVPSQSNRSAEPKPEPGPHRSAEPEPFQVIDYSEGVDLGSDEPGDEDFDTASPSKDISLSSDRKLKAPPPTPATEAATSHAAIMPVKSVHADGTDVLRTIAESSNLNLNDSIYATKNYKRAWVPAGKRTSTFMPARPTPMTSFSTPFAVLDENKAPESPSNKTTQGKLINNYQDKTVTKFLKDKAPEIEKKPERETEPFPAMEDIDMDVAVTPESSTDKVTQSTDETPEASKAGTGLPQMVITPASDDVNTSTVTHAHSAAVYGASDDINTNTNTVARAPEVAVENREQLQHFSSWGTPTPRFRPAARIRKITLTNLPAESDLTLVQSLIYGGAIETFNLSTNRTSAYVVFVNPDACDAYFNAHPNGIVYRNPKTRRNHTVFVDKGHDVDIVSGVLQAYLECQASRVVRASGADEDWGMRALYKLAESKNRKVETIVDTYRDKIRTIIFRFTNIADAVTFRGQLIRDAEWEMCNIQFADDPAEKATGVHLED